MYISAFFSFSLPLSCVGAWGLQRTPFESQFSFHHVDPRDQTQAIKLGGKHLYLLSRLVAQLPELLRTIGSISIVILACPKKPRLFRK